MSSPLCLLVSALLLVFANFAIGAPTVILANGNGTDPYLDRDCGATLKNMWLEIVFVVDNSKGMTSEALSVIASNMMAVMDGGITIGLDSSNPRTTRVGIVLYNKDATIVANLDAFSSYNDFVNSIFSNMGSVANVDESYISQGLAAAEQVLQDGSRDDRALVKQVIVLYASTYDGNGNYDPVPVANRLKTDDIQIVTVAFAQKNEGALLKNLQKIASPGLNFTNSDAKLPLSIQNGLLQVNCFCPNGWRQYQQDFANIGSKKFGICIKPLELSGNWVGGKMACNGQWKNGYLVNEYTQHKHDFVLNVVKSNPTFSAPYAYFIGLSYYSNNWYWEQPFGNSGRPFTTGSWTNWNPGFPLIDSTRMVGMAHGFNQSALTTGWENVARNSLQFAVCEVISCDTDNYCQNVD